MKMQGDSTTGAGHAGLIDALNEVFAPGKEHMKEQQQYDEKVGRRPSKKSGSPLDFNGNAITLAVDPSKEEAKAEEVSVAETEVPAESPAEAVAETGKKERPHRAKRQTPK